MPKGVPVKAHTPEKKAAVSSMKGLLMLYVLSKSVGCLVRNESSGRLFHAQQGSYSYRPA
ncbi:hypothetical protein SCFA_620022 [anaerobic digester metagenome]|uniref:Uncharacterized protein n=1 Tax=anaerobic digester metagenome TaxID=1263854 RepID=A0A485M397_9ZZZZ